MKQPLLLMTRPEPGAIRFVRGLRPEVLERVRVVMSPLIEIVPTALDPQIDRFAGAIFTSVHGVRFAGAGQGRTAYCVGQITARAATDSGWHVRLVSATADALIECMKSQHVVGPLVHLAGRHRRGDIARELTHAGTETALVILYDQALLPIGAEARAALSGANAVIAPLFSPRTASQFITQVNTFARFHFVCISDAVAQVVAKCEPASVTVASEPTGRAMTACVEKLLCRKGLA